MVINRENGEVRVTQEILVEMMHNIILVQRRRYVDRENIVHFRKSALILAIPLIYAKKFLED